MKNEKNDVEVLINGRTYTICGFESAEYLQQIAGYINRKYAEFQKMENYKQMDVELRNVLLAINISDEYYKEKKRASEYRTENELREKMVLDMKHEIIKLQEREKKKDKRIAELEAQLEKSEKKIVELETRLKPRK